MAVYMPPLVRKKRVYDRYNPDSFRVISTEAEAHQEYQQFVPAQQHTFLDPLQPKDCAPYVYNRRTQVLPKSMPDYRANRPHPEANDFLREDVLLLSEPICSVHTRDTHSEQDSWWPSRISEEPIDTPAYTLNSTYRKDFRKAKQYDSVASRLGCNPITEPALGLVPVNWLRGKDGQQRLWKEGLSYEQEYNCRLDPSYPIRGKRHGAFVWKGLAHEEAQRFIEHHTNMDSNQTQQKSSRGDERASRQSPPREINVAEASMLSWPVCGTGNNPKELSVISPVQDVANTGSRKASPSETSQRRTSVTSSSHGTETVVNLQAAACTSNGDMAPVEE